LPPPTLLAERLTAQRLGGPPATTVLEVVDQLLAVQAQDPRGARLAVRARSTGLTADDVETALTTDRSVVITTVNRGTLHLIRSDDYWWLHELTTPQLRTSSDTRLAQEHLSADDVARGIAVIESVLGDCGPSDRATLRQHIVAAGIRVERQAFAHLLFRAAIDGLIVRGPVVAREQSFVLGRDWLGPAPRRLDRDAALGELARRYLRGHGPAADADLARWAGVTLGDARRGLRAIAGALVERTDGLAALPTAIPPAIPPPRLLGSFDPSLLGWVSREPIIGTSRGIVTSNGVFRPFAMVRGRADASWTLTRRDLVITPFGPMAAATWRALTTDAAAVLNFLYPPS
jgi:Winged helix DNA-binding domain